MQVGEIPPTGSKDIVDLRSGVPTGSALKPICSPSSLLGGGGGGGGGGEDIVTLTKTISLFKVFF